MNTEQRITELEKQIKDLISYINLFKSSSSIPLEIDQAFRDRFIASTTALAVSVKGVDTEDVTVSESGSSSYAVMNDPDGFLQITIGGTIYYLPYFN